jgi:hypothetical protein
MMNVEENIAEVTSPPGTVQMFDDLQKEMIQGELKFVYVGVAFAVAALGGEHAAAAKGAPGIMGA